MSAQYKNINNTKLYKSIVYKYKFWQRQSLFGTSTFSENIGLAASVSCRENRCFSVRIHALNDGIVRGDCPVLCCAAPCGIAPPDSGRRWSMNAMLFCMFICSDFCQVLSRVHLFSPRSIECPTSWLSESFDSELFNESSSFTVSEFEVWNTLHHHVIVLALLHFNFHQ